MGWIRLAAAFLAMSVLTAGPRVQAQTGTPLSDVFDQFFRFPDPERKVVFEEVPGETIDLFSGNLSLIQRDLVLPGKAGLDFAVTRTYGSKIWGRSDLLAMEPLLAEKEHSVLGYGWSFHMGRLRSPNAITPVEGCGGEFPVFEAPDGSARVFYPVPGNNKVFRSKDFWRMELDCTSLGGPGMGACVWSDAGVRYELSNSNQFFVGVTPVWPVSRIVDRFGNRIGVDYLSQTGAVCSVTDTYGRTITFAYTDVNGMPATRRPGDGLLYLGTMTANGNTWTYVYTTYTPTQTGGVGLLPLPGPRRFLTEVRPPVGPPYYYTYAYDKPVTQNQYALTSVTYPAGGNTTYAYSPVSFFTGLDTVPFSVVTQRTVAGRAVTPATWTYAYVSPGPPPQGEDPEDYLHVGTVVRPDGVQEQHKLIGFGFVAGMNQNNYTYAVGLPVQVLRGNVEAEARSWDPNQVPLISWAPFSAPAYSSNCGAHLVWDQAVFIPVMTERGIWRDAEGAGEWGAEFVTTFEDFDAYGQAKTVKELGDQGAGSLARVTTWTYLSVPTEGDATLNLVRGIPLTQHVCVGNGCIDPGYACQGRDCYDNSWSYKPEFHYVLGSESKSGVTTTFDYHRADPEGPGNLKSITSALGQTLTATGYADVPGGVGGGTPTVIDMNAAFRILRTQSWEGRVTSETDGRHYTTSYDYDAIGRIKTLTPPAPNLASTYTYPNGWTVRLDRGAYYEEGTLDGLGRVTSLVTSVGLKQTKAYDTMGRTSFTSYPWDDREVGVKLEFDGLGRVLTERRGYRPATASCETPGACKVTNVYRWNCVATTVERGIDDAPTTWGCKMSLGNPDEGRLTQLWDAENHYWEYSYTAAGKLASVFAPLAQADRLYRYDDRQYLTSETSGETATIVYGRNALGQMTSRSDERPVTTTYDYHEDPLSRLRKTWYQAGTPDDARTDYDNANNLWRVSSANGGAFEYLYDELNRPLTQTWAYEGRPPYTTAYHYDDAGCRDSMTYPSGATLTMTCDSANRPTSVTLQAGGAATTIINNVTYHPSGHVKAMTYGNGTTTSVQQDDRTRVATVSVTPPGVLELSYAYDGADNLTTLVNSVSGSVQTMMYDNLDRMLTSIAPSQWGTAVYDYDAVGNRILNSVGSYTTTYTYDPTTNRLASATGGLAPLMTMKLAWDPAGHLASTSDGTTYRYDGQGRRIMKSGPDRTTLYHYDAAGRVIAETLRDGTKLRDYIYFGNALVAVNGCVSGDTPPCTETQWYHTDALGSPQARTDLSGTVVARVDYNAWGEPWGSVGVAGDRQYNGRILRPGNWFPRLRRANVLVADREVHQPRYRSRPCGEPCVAEQVQLRLEQPVQVRGSRWTNTAGNRNRCLGGRHSRRDHRVPARRRRRNRRGRGDRGAGRPCHPGWSSRGCGARDGWRSRDWGGHRGQGQRSPHHEHGIGWRCRRDAGCTGYAGNKQDGVGRRRRRRAPDRRGEPESGATSRTDSLSGRE